MAEFGFVISTDEEVTPHLIESMDKVLFKNFEHAQKENPLLEGKTPEFLDSKELGSRNLIVENKDEYARGWYVKIDD